MHIREQPGAPLILTPSSLLQSSVCAKIVQLLGQNEVDCRQKQVVILSQDSFYRVLTSEQKAKALKGQFNFDHPGESAVEGRVCACVYVCVCLPVSVRALAGSLRTLFDPLESVWITRG